MTRWPNHQTFPAVSSAYHRTASVDGGRPGRRTSHRTAVVATPSITRGAGSTVAVSVSDPVFA